jgi:hypothetical protein
MMDIQELVKLAEEWHKTVPKEMRNQIIVSNFSIKPMSFTPNQILSKIKAAGRRAKTKEEFLEQSGLCAEFIVTLEKMHQRRAKRQKPKSKDQKQHKKGGNHEHDE